MPDILVNVVRPGDETVVGVIRDVLPVSVTVFTEPILSSFMKLPFEASDFP